MNFARRNRYFLYGYIMGIISMSITSSQFWHCRDITGQWFILYTSCISFSLGYYQDLCWLHFAHAIVILMFKQVQLFVFVRWMERHSNFTLFVWAIGLQIIPWERERVSDSFCMPDGFRNAIRDNGMECLPVIVYNILFFSVVSLQVVQEGVGAEVGGDRKNEFSLSILPALNWKILLFKKVKKIYIMSVQYYTHWFVPYNIITYYV